MRRKFFKKGKKAGSSPGSVVHVGTKKVDNVQFSILSYNQDKLDEHSATSAQEVLNQLMPDRVNWLNIDGLHDTESIQAIGDNFRLHSLILEDIVNTGQRPKLETYDDVLFLPLKMLLYDRNHKQIRTEQISLLLLSNSVLSFQEWHSDVFEPVRSRIQNARPRIRKLGADYLFYALLDAAVDSYFSILEFIGEELEILDEEVLKEPTADTLSALYRIRRELALLRRSVWPLREALGLLERSESELVKAGTNLFLRDVYDHSFQIIEIVESYRDIAGSMLDLYSSHISNRMNEVMKVLTIIATIFIPLSFIAGIYGMNFEHMPELAWRYGYGIFWLVVVAVAGIMLWSFKKQKWI